jgi:hypothetical protein
LQFLSLQQFPPIFEFFLRLFVLLFQFQFSHIGLINAIEIGASLNKKVS